MTARSSGNAWLAERLAGGVQGVQEFRSSGVQEFRSSGVQEFRSSGVQEFRSSGVQEVRVEELEYSKIKAPADQIWDSPSDIYSGLLNSFIFVRGSRSV